MSDTNLKWEKLCCAGYSWYRIAEQMKTYCQEQERERDEAREDLRDIKEYGTEEINAAVELRQKLASALVERDEAREELHDIRLNLGADAEGYTLIHAVCVLQQERDEAREIAHDLAVIASHCLGSHSFSFSETSERIADTLKRWRSTQPCKK